MKKILVFTFTLSVFALDLSYESGAGKGTRIRNLKEAPHLAKHITHNGVDYLQIQHTLAQDKEWFGKIEKSNDNKTYRPLNSAETSESEEKRKCIISSQKFLPYDNIDIDPLSNLSISAKKIERRDVLTRTLQDYETGWIGFEATVKGVYPFNDPNVIIRTDKDEIFINDPSPFGKNRYQEENKEVLESAIKSMTCKSELAEYSRIQEVQVLLKNDSINLTYKVDCVTDANDPDQLIRSLKYLRLTCQKAKTL